MPVPRAAFAAVLAGTTPVAAQQWQWLPDRALPGDFQGAMAYDEARERLVLSGSGVPGDEALRTDSRTYEWDGARWLLRHRETTQVRDAALCWDPARRRIVRTCGSYDGFPGAATWEWDGASWTLRVASGLAARHSHGAACDANGRLVVFGGSTQPFSPGFLGDTWELAGATWTPRTGTPAPPLRHGHAMVHDAPRGRTLLFGGVTTGPWWNPFRSDTWEWDGAAWQQRQPATVPPARFGAALALDAARGRVVLFGGADAAERDDTWEWDGTDWHAVATAHRPGPRTRAAMAYDRRAGRTMLYGGRAGLGYERRTDTWSYDGVDWQLVLPATGPARRVVPALTHDPLRGATLAFAGFPGDDLTWETDGRNWRGALVVPSPARRYEQHAAFDLWRGRTVLFGGRDNVVFGDTWEWDGVAWTLRATTTSPPPRWGGCMAFDVGRGVCVLFGGQDFAGAFADTWEWNGASWAQRLPVHTPTAGSSHEMVYDLLLGRIVMFGGSDAAGARADTWHWDGVDWTLMGTAGPQAPPPRYYFALAWHAARGRTVLFGGGTWGSYRDDLWEWDGSQWTPWNVAPRPPPQSDPALVYDFANQRLVLCSGSSGQTYGDWWLLVPAAPASTTTYGSGCGAGPPPVLRGDPPFLGNAGGTLELSLAAAQCPTLLLGGLGAANVPLPGGCALLLQAPFVTALAATNPHGVARFPVAVPATPALRGATAHFQAAVLDGSGPLFGSSWTGDRKSVV